MPMSAVPQRMLGSTGERVSMIGLGGFHIGKQADPAESVRIIRAAVDAGITFLDNSWDYHGGESERRMGRALRDGYRERVFLMTKIDGRDAATARTQLDESLARLETDRLDLLQFHEVIRPEDADRIFAAGGALEAVLDARAAGKVRYIGFTGHKSPDIHLRMLETAAAHGFAFDTVQMPLSVLDAHFESFQHRVLPLLQQRRIAALGMKPLAEGHLLETRTVTAVDALHYALNLPVSVVITGIDSLPVLEQAVAAAASFVPLAAAEVDAVLAKTESVARDGRFERYKTTRGNDSTFEHPEWLGPAPAGAPAQRPGAP